MAMGFNIDVDVPKVVTIGTVSVVILALTLIGTHGFYLKYAQDEFAAKNYAARSPLVEEVNKAAGEHLDKYRWANPERSAAQLPIDEAIRVMAASKGRPPATQPMGPTTATGAPGGRM